MDIIVELIEKNGRVDGNLIGVDSNAFAVIGYTTGRLRIGGWPKEDVNKVSKIAMSGDYNFLVATCAATLTFE